MLAQSRRAVVRTTLTNHPGEEGSYWFDGATVGCLGTAPLHYPQIVPTRTPGLPRAVAEMRTARNPDAAPQARTSYAVRDANGRFKDIQTYKRAQGRDSK